MGILDFETTVPQSLQGPGVCRRQPGMNASWANSSEDFCRSSIECGLPYPIKGQGNTLKFYPG